MHRSRWLAFVASMGFLFVALPARAHQVGRSYCSVSTVPGGIDVTVETGAEHLGLKPEPSDADLLAARGELLDELAREVTATTPSGACTAKPGEFELVTREGVRAVALGLHFSCPSGPVTLRNAWRLSADPTSEVVCAIDGRAWAFRQGLEERDVGTPPTLLQVLGSFVKLGMVHVFSGIDHVLFVIALLVAAARASREKTLARGLRGMAAVVTGFTIGHSLTLVAAGLNLIRVEPRVTESVIALSIVVVGAENYFRREIRWRALTAMVFGLVHGFGFASVLAETELPRRGAVAALLAFNVGIECAQLTIVGVAFPLLALAARRAWYERALYKPVSAAVAMIAAIWFVKRAAGVNFWPWLGS
jgi:hydrogenase/urease accessory protein HupE